MSLNDALSTHFKQLQSHKMYSISTQIYTLQRTTRFLLHVHVHVLHVAWSLGQLEEAKNSPPPTLAA